MRAVQWHCKRQGLATGSTTNATIAQDNTADVAVHSTGAEVLALLDACSPVRVIRNLLAEAGAAGQPPTEVFTDSTGAIKYMDRDSTPNLRQWNIRCHSARQLVRNDVTTYKHVPGHSNRADALTKRLPISAFTRHARALLGARS